MSSIFELRATVLILLSAVITTVNAHGPDCENLKDPFVVGPEKNGLDP